jgi:hypothetical protein
MFHYRIWSYRSQDYTVKRSADIQVGDRVRSRFRAGWTGNVLSLDPRGGIAEVEATHDRHGRPMRKRRTYHYQVSWFRVIERT